MAGPTDEQIRWTAELMQIDEEKIRSHSDLQLLFEEKTLTDKLDKPVSYQGREHDQELKGAINDERARRTAQRGADKRLTDLIEDSKQEIGPLAVNTDSLHDTVTPETIQGYLDLFQELGDMIENGEASLKSGMPLPENVLAEWSDALHEASELRHMLTGDLASNNDAQLKLGQQNLTQLMVRLGKLQHSMKEIKSAVEQVSDGENWVSRMLWVNDQVEKLRGVVTKAEAAEKAIETVKGLVKDELEAYAGFKLELVHVASMSDLIESGVKNLGDYSIQLAIAGEGFSSVKELETSLAVVTSEIKKQSEDLQCLTDRKQKLEEKYAVPLKGMSKH